MSCGDHTAVVVKTDVVVAEIAHGAEAINDVEFNESESFDGSNSSEFVLKSHNFAIDHEAFFPHSKYFCCRSYEECVSLLSSR